MAHRIVFDGNMSVRMKSLGRVDKGGDTMKTRFRDDTVEETFIHSYHLSGTHESWDLVHAADALPSPFWACHLPAPSLVRLLY